MNDKAAYLATGISIILFMLSFQMKGQDGYVRYQTFDEYKMEGVEAEKTKRPYVLVKKEVDTIFVIKSYDRTKKIKYVNRGDYWYTILHIQTTKVGEIFCEKFIYNDTVVEYEYYKIDSLRYNNGISVHTKKDCIELVIHRNDIKNYDDPFNEIKELVTNYKEIFPLYSPGHQPRWYSILRKHIEGNILYIYDMNGINKGDVYSKKMNSLGEFDNNGMLRWW